MKCLFDQWYDGEAQNLNNFTIKLFEALMVADGLNRDKFKIAWPEYFKDCKNF